jgi:hypothetical protein
MRCPVGGHLPLVVPDHAQLQKLSLILLEGQNLLNTPLDCECLPRRLGRIIHTCPASMNLPIREEVRAGSLILCDIERCSRLKVVAKVTTADVAKDVLDPLVKQLRVQRGAIVFCSALMTVIVLKGIWKLPKWISALLKGEKPSEDRLGDTPCGYRFLP